MKTIARGLLVSLLLCIGCAGPRGAKKIAQVSSQAYNAASDEVVREMKVLADKHDGVGWDESDKAKFRVLNKIRSILDQYAEKHNAYVKALQLAATASKMPTAVVSLQQQLLDLIRQAADLSNTIGLKWAKENYDDVQGHAEPAAR